MVKVYLGDSVYAQFDGHGILLTTENRLPTDPSNRIYLEPEVVNGLLVLLDAIKQEAATPSPSIPVPEPIEAALGVDVMSMLAHIQQYGCDGMAGEVKTLLNRVHNYVLKTQGAKT